MSLRRFVYLVTTDTTNCSSYLLRRIDMSRLFHPPTDRRDADPPSTPQEEARLPPPAVRFNCPPVTDSACNGDMAFMLLAGGGGAGRIRTMVVATDHTGRAALVDPDRRAVRTLPDLTAPKAASVSVTVGGNLYVLGTRPRPGIDRGLCFDGLFRRQEHRRRGDDEWCCRSLPPPPYVLEHHRGYRADAAADVTSYAVVGGAGAGGGGPATIWVSKPPMGTHAFDVAAGVWSKAGDWALPFSGHAQYVPEHGLWFGLSSPGDGDGGGGVLCAADLTAAAPPARRGVWRDVAAAGWASRAAYLVHLGRSKFCLARFFESRRPDGLCHDFVVFTGIEVEGCGETAGGELRMMKHRSRRYSHDDAKLGTAQWVL